MKLAILFISSFLFVSCASGNEKRFTGSTPAGITVKTFLGIPLTDSVDFIRWDLTITEGRFRLACNYGISKANTNGFIQGGKKTIFEGNLEKENNRYELLNSGRSLKLAILNENLLHLLDTDNGFLKGNGGWSYTLNNTTPVANDELNFIAQAGILKDSMAIEGRTPCNIPGIVEPGQSCYKLKWLIVLYADTASQQPTTYRIMASNWWKEGGMAGTWEIVPGKNSRIIYLLKNKAGNKLLYLVKAADNILLFTDASGNLLTGNEDFSYTLNRKW